MCRASVLGGQLQDVKRKPLCARRASAGSLLELTSDDEKQYLISNLQLQLVAL